MHADDDDDVVNAPLQQGRERKKKKRERERGKEEENTEADAQMMILAYAESVRNMIAGRIHADRTLLQYDHTQRLRPLLPRFEIEQKVASQSAPSFETYCTREAEQRRLKRDRSYAGRFLLGWGFRCTITSGRRRDEEDDIFALFSSLRTDKQQ